MVDPLADVNNGIVNAISGVNWISIISWVVFGIILIGGGFWYYIYSRDKKVYNKNISVFDIVGNFYQFAFRDKAKVVKIGSGGFEILYLKKFKTWKIAYGGRVGKDTYYFFIAPDGYWYNGMLSADLKSIDKNGGMIPIVTTNPSMRAQYTSLEKQLDKLYEQKKGFMEKYGSWVFAIGFVLIAGVMLWLMAQEMAKTVGGNAAVTDKLVTLVERVNTLIANTQGIGGNGGLVPAT